MSPELITPDMRVSELFGKEAGDSLDSVELVMELEEEFDLEPSDAEMATIQTFGEALNYLERRRRARGG